MAHDVPILVPFSPPTARRKTGLKRWTTAAILITGCILIAGSRAFCSGTMNGPPGTKPRSPTSNTLETSAIRIAFIGAIEFYQKRISPISEPRCGFYPSCSAYGLQAVREQGPLQGVIMTGDRLTRCNIFKGPGADYLLLPTGRLFDPLSRNLLSDQ